MIKLSLGKKEFQYIPFDGPYDEAKAYENQLRGITNSSDPSFLDKYSDFMVAYKNASEASTVVDFGFAWLKIKPFFMNMKIRMITEIIIERYKAHRLATLYRGKAISKSRINTELAYLGKYLKFCGNNVRVPRFDKKDCVAAPPEVMTLDTMNKVIDALDGSVKHLVQLMTFNGLRKQEAFNLESKNVSVDGNTLKILGKGNKWRIAPVESPDLLQAIIDAKKERPDGYLFPNLRPGKYYGKPYTDIRKSLKPAGKVAEVGRIYNHLFRHSFATDMAGEDENVLVLQNLLGHADVKETQKYVHLANKTMRRATARMAERSANSANG